MRVPEIYSAINAVSAELAEAGIAKAHTNLIDQYQYRSIDDVLNRLAPLLAKHRMCVLPRVLERSSERCMARGDIAITSICLRVAFDLVSAVDASSHTVESFGEALDEGDKGTAKAMSSAYKVAMLQAFCIPVPGNDDADARSIRLRVTSSLGAPVEGWDQWSHGIIDTLRICESIEAVDRLQSSKRRQLKDISRERPDLYTHLGEQFTDRRRTLVLLSSSPQAKRSDTKAKNPGAASSPTTSNGQPLVEA